MLKMHYAHADPQPRALGWWRCRYRLAVTAPLSSASLALSSAFQAHTSLNPNAQIHRSKTPVGLPQLDVRQEPPPRRHGVVVVQLSDFSLAEGASARDKVRRLWVAPGGLHYDLVGGCEDDNNKNTNGVLEEVVCAERGGAL